MAKTLLEMIAEAKKQISLFSVQEVKRRLDAAEDFILVDVREKDEYDQARIKGAVHIPRGVLEMKVDRASRGFDPRFSNPEKLIVLHCAAGGRSALAAKTLREMGFTTVASMEGGIEAWIRAGYPCDTCGTSP